MANTLSIVRLVRPVADASQLADGISRRTLPSSDPTGRSDDYRTNRGPDYNRPRLRPRRSIGIPPLVEGITEVEDYFDAPVRRDRFRRDRVGRPGKGPHSRDEMIESHRRRKVSVP